MLSVTSVYSVTVCWLPSISMYVTASFAHAVIAVSTLRSSVVAALISNDFCVVLVLILLNDLEFYCLVRVGKKQCGPLLLAHVLNL